MFLSGCVYWPTIKAEQFDSDLILKPEETAGNSAKNEYQYTVPWDSSIFDEYYANARNVPEIGDVRGGIVPHHLLAGYIPATFFKKLEKQKPSLIILLGPNHLNAGGANAISTLLDWQTPYGVVRTDKELVGRLAERGIVKIQEEIMKDEHSIYSILPFMAKSVPNAKVLPIIFSYKTDVGKLNEILAVLLPQLPKDAVVVSSVDFSHYQTLDASNFHDELSRAVIKNFDYGRLDNLEVDSAPSLYLMMRLLENMSAQRVAFEISDNSAHLLNDATLKEGTSYFSPYFVDGVKEKEKIASILNFGDLMLDRDVKQKIDANSSDYLLSKLAGQENRFFLGMDAIGANLEGPFANYRRPTSKSIAFQFDPKLILMLKKYNFSILNNANNHTLDMGKDGFVESQNNLMKAGIDYYGAQYDIDDNSYVIKKVGDYNIAFLGLNDTNARVNLKLTKSIVEKIKPKSDFIIANVHWGQEYQKTSNSLQRKLARELIDLGVDAIIGHHPHVVQEMEIYKNRPIFYSLGNFVFDQYFSEATQQELGVGLVFRDKSISAYVFPLQSVKSQISQMNYANAIKFTSDWTAKSRLGDNKFNNFNLKINF